MYGPVTKITTMRVPTRKRKGSVNEKDRHQ